MNHWIIATIGSLIAGAVITVSGLALPVDQIMAETQHTVNQANEHQLRTALEVYFVQTGRYPVVYSTKDLIRVLSDSGILIKEPIEEDIFQYQSFNEGLDYRLIMKD